METLARRAKGLPKVNRTEFKRLEATYKPQMDELARGMQQVGMQAGMNSQGEASLMAAPQKFAQVAARVESELK